MRYARKLLLLAVMAITAFAFSAASASAILPVEVTEEPGGAHCDAISYVDHRADGGCHLQVHGTGVLLIQHRAGGDVVVNNCTNDYELRLDENGEGWIQDVSFSVGPGCGTAVTPCSEEGALPGDFPWHIDIEHDGVGNEVGEAEICIKEVIAAGVSCEFEGDIDIAIGEEEHALTAEADDATFAVEDITAHPGAAQPNCVGLANLGAFEVDAHWVITPEDTDPAVEIEHLEG